MAIQVTCGKCFTRFTVSEKFAGQTGPCPKCKSVITIPSAATQVVIHERESAAKDTTGRPLSRPVFREEAPISAIHWTIAVCTALIMLVVAIVGRNLYSVETFPWWALGFGALICSWPVSLVGYIVLRNPEAGGFGGQELWLRVAVVAIGFAALWGFAPLAAFAFADSVGKPSFLSQSVAMVVLMLAGAGISMLALDLDYLYGIVHSVSYAVLCILMRMLAGLSAIPGFDGTERVAPVAPRVFGWATPDGWLPFISECVAQLPATLGSFGILSL